MSNYDVRTVWRRSSRPIVRRFSPADRRGLELVLAETATVLLPVFHERSAVEFFREHANAPSAVIEVDGRLVGACVTSTARGIPTRPAHPWSAVDMPAEAEPSDGWLEIDLLFWAANAIDDAAGLLQTCAVVPTRESGFGGVVTYLSLPRSTTAAEAQLQQLLARPDDFGPASLLLEAGFRLQGYLPGVGEAPRAVFRWENPAT